MLGGSVIIFIVCAAGWNCDKNLRGWHAWRRRVYVQSVISMLDEVWPWEFTRVSGILYNQDDIKSEWRKKMCSTKIRTLALVCAAQPSSLVSEWLQMSRQYEQCYSLDDLDSSCNLKIFHTFFKPLRQFQASQQQLVSRLAPCSTAFFYL